MCGFAGEREIERERERINLQYDFAVATIAVTINLLEVEFRTAQRARQLTEFNQDQQTC